VWALTSPTFGAFKATVTNNGNTAGTTELLLTGSDGTGTACANTSPITATQSISCLRTTLPTSAGNGSASSQSVTLTASGTSPGYASMQATACGPVRLDNQRTAADMMVVRGSPSAFAASGPGTISGSTGLTFDGSTALGTDIVQTTSGALGTTLTQGVWFKTGAATGTLIDFSDSSSAIGESRSDPAITLSGGKVVFSVKTTLGLGTVTVTSGSTYNDGNWHFAVGTTSGGLFTTANLYVDGASAGSGGGGLLGLLSGHNGYWHVGWSNAGGYLNGTLSNAFVVDGTALSGAQVSTLYGESSQVNWQSALATDGATDSWNLADTGTTTVPTGTSMPGIGLTDPCSLVAVAVGSGSYCIYPSGGSACATPNASSNTLKQWVAAGVQTFTATPVGSPVSETTKTIRATGYDTTFMPDLRLYVPVSVTESLSNGSPWSTTLKWDQWTQALRG